MDLLVVVIAGVAGLALGVVLGLKSGDLIAGGPKWRYWALNLGAFIAGVVMEAVAFVYGLLWLRVGALLWLAGMFTGLKYGFGAVPLARTLRERREAERAHAGPVHEDERAAE